MTQGLTPLGIAIFVAILLISMVIHEFMHAYVGFKLGDTTAMEHGRISFNPLRHIDPFMTILLPIVSILWFHVPLLAAKPVPFDPRQVRYGEYGAAMLAAAGPLSNLAIAIVAALIGNSLHVGGGWHDVLSIAVELNVALFIFNMIPIPPLDGSRILYAFAPEPLQELMQRLEQYGLFIIFALVLWGGAGGWLAHLNQFVLNWLQWS